MKIRKFSPPKNFLLLHGAVAEDAIIQDVLVLIAVAVAGRQVYGTGVAVLVETAAAVHAAVVMGDATGIAVRIMVARSAHLETIAVARRQFTVAVRLATGERSSGRSHQVCRHHRSHRQARGTP